MKQLLFILSVWVVSLTAAAQNQAETILQQAAEAYQQAEGVEAQFRIDIKTPEGKQAGSIDGIIQLKGNKFKLQVPDEMVTWFDGSNQWLYLIRTEEVNLSTPTQEELLMMNPVNVFMLYRHGFDGRLIGETTHRGKKAWHLSLRPQTADSSIQTIELYFEQSSLQPLSICISQTDASGSVITINQYKTNQRYADQLFVFPQKDYPMAEVIDLR